MSRPYYSLTVIKYHRKPYPKFELVHAVIKFCKLKIFSEDNDYQNKCMHTIYAETVITSKYSRNMLTI